MKPNDLYVVTAVANPLRWKSRLRLYRDFEHHMLGSGVRLVVVECAYGDRPHELDPSLGVMHIPVRARSVVWTKENLINLGIARLPDDWKYVAWIDADITFRNTDWAVETLHALQVHEVVQPWSHCYDLGPNDDHIAVHHSFCRQFVEGQPVGPSAYPFSHPGYAWAARRRAIDHVGGLIETAALGAADHHMALALAGKVEFSIPSGLTDGYRFPLTQWQRRAEQWVARNIGHVRGTIEHSWHGAKAKRRYVERWDILMRHKFDPSVDLVRNATGVLELSGNKPELDAAIRQYFSLRDEDSNSLGSS